MAERKGGAEICLSGGYVAPSQLFSCGTYDHVQHSTDFPPLALHEFHTQPRDFFFNWRNLSISVPTLHSLNHRFLRLLTMEDAYYEEQMGVFVDNMLLRVHMFGNGWRLLRRNLTSEILHPSRVKTYSAARQWVLGILIDRLIGESRSAAAVEGVRVLDHFHYAMFSLLVFICFGDRLDEKQIKEVERVQRQATEIESAYFLELLVYQN